MNDARQGDSSSTITAASLNAPSTRLTAAISCRSSSRIAPPALDPCRPCRSDLRRGRLPTGNRSRSFDRTCRGFYAPHHQFVVAERTGMQYHVERRINNQPPEVEDVAVPGLVRTLTMVAKELEIRAGDPPRVELTVRTIGA